MLGRPVLDWDRVALARQVGLVLQTPVLFKRTVRDNTARVLALAGEPGGRAEHEKRAVMVP